MDTNLLVLAVAGMVVAAFVLPALGRRRAMRLREERDVRLRREAAAAGLRYGSGDAPAAGPGAVDAAAHARVFSGSAGMLAWTAEVEVDADRPGPSNRRSRRSSTRITFGGVRASPGRFVIAMAVPPEVQVPAVPSGGGLLAKVAAKAAEGLLDLYVGGYFGARHRALVNVEGAERPAAPPGFFVLSTDAPLAGRLLAPEAVALLEGLRDAVPGQPHFGLLVAPEGLAWAVPAAVTDTSALKPLAERVAALASKLRR
jgi:hypothetical protein